MSTVNLAEVQGKLVSNGIASDQAWEAILSAIHAGLWLIHEQAKLAESLRRMQTRSLGLSLGDRACLALGVVLKAPVYTADRRWANLKLGIRIHIIR